MNCLADAHTDASYKAMTAQPGVTSLAHWYVAKVRSRHEFVAYDELLGKRFEAMLPSIKKSSRWKDRKKVIAFPLFPGYVFVKVPVHPGAFLEVLKTRGIVAFITLEPGTPTPVAPDEVASLRLLMESGKEIDVYPDLKEGTQVRIKSGLLANAQGILIRKNNECLFLVNIELLGRSVAVRIAAEDLEAA